MSFKEYLKEMFSEFEDIDDIVNSDLVKETSDELFSNDLEYYRDIKSILKRALNYRNINNGVEWFKEEIDNRYMDETITKRLLSLLNWAQRQATKIEPDYYV